MAKKKPPSTADEARTIAQDQFAEFQIRCERCRREVYWAAAEELIASLEGVLMERQEHQGRV